MLVHLLKKDQFKFDVLLSECREPAKEVGKPSGSIAKLILQEEITQAYRAWQIAVGRQGFDIGIEDAIH